jgi:putative aldouronate transport system permease protein
MDKMTKKSIFQLINAILLLLLTITTIYPFVNLLAVSLTDAKEIAYMTGLDIIPKKLSFDVYKALFTSPQVYKAFFSSIYITGMGTVLNMVLTIITAYALSRKNFYGKKLYMIFLIIPMLFDGGLIPNYMLIKNLGLIDSYWSVILPGTINVYYLMLLKNVFQSVPQSIYEAAEIDGAGHFTMIWKIAVPLAKPGIITIGLFYAILRWNEYFKPLIYINNPDKWPLQVLLRQFIVDSDKGALFGTQTLLNYSSGATAIPFRSLQAGIIIITVIPILLLYPLLLKYFNNVTVGAVKE